MSEADRVVEAEIRHALAAIFPEDGVVGEEQGASAGSSGYLWVVDPIDGTSPFLHGQPNWCVSIAAVGPQGPVAGVVHAPLLGETFWARRGGGAFLGKRRLAMDEAVTIRSANLAFGASGKSEPDAVGRFAAALYREGGVMFRIGSGALMLCYVAARRLAGYYDPLIHCWDCFAGNLIVEEAGGQVDFRGDLERGGPLYAGPANVVSDLIRLAERS